MTIRGDQHVDDWIEVAVDYLDGQVDAATKAAVESHLAGCPDCANRLKAQQGVVRFLQQTVLDEAPEDLEYRTLGELVFPSPGGKPVFEPPASVERPRSSRLARRLRPWIPVSVAVVALLAAVTGYGIMRSGADQTSSDVAGTFSTKTEATAESSEASADATGGRLATPATTTAVGTAPSTTKTTTPTTTAVAAVSITADRRTMIRQLEAAQAPTYVAFQAQEVTPASDVSTETTSVDSGDEPLMAPLAVTAEQASEVVSQIAEFSGLEPLDESLWLGGPTYAVYLPRIDAEELVDLVRSIGASCGLLVVVRGGPPERAKDVATKLMEHKKRFPILEAARAPQPATWGFSFTTSTLADDPGSPDDTQQTGETSSTTMPDQSGDHILLVIYVQQGSF
jgi:hypothetical protein